MFAWLIVVEIINDAEAGIEELIEKYRESIRSRWEINLLLSDVNQIFVNVLLKYEPDALNVDHFDRPRFEMPENWRFTLRQSKTESLIHNKY